MEAQTKMDPMEIKYTRAMCTIKNRLGVSGQPEKGHPANQPGRGPQGPKRRLLAVTLLMSSALAPALHAQQPTIADGTYVLAEADAKAYNYSSAQSTVLASLQADDLLLVHGEKVGFLQVSAPKGFPVWVYGQYLEETATEGILHVIGSGVRMRGQPKGGTGSYPLMEKLQRGDLVQWMERADDSLAFEEDWIRVRSVSRAKVWVPTSSVRIASDQASAKAAWAAALPAFVYRPKVTEPTAPEVAEKPAPAEHKQEPAIKEEAYRSLNWGKTLLAKAEAKGEAAQQADFDRAVGAFNVVIEMVPAGTRVAEEAQMQLQKAKMGLLAASVRADLAAAEIRQRKMVAEWAEAKRQAELEKTAHWGRFMGRGWVEKTGRGDEARYFLRWGGELVFEISCDSGRYDLDLFQGFELGVRGTTLRAASMATEEFPAQVALMDISRLEVISGSASK